MRPSWPRSELEGRRSGRLTAGGYEEELFNPWESSPYPDECEDNYDTACGPTVRPFLHPLDGEWSDLADITEAVPDHWNPALYAGMENWVARKIDGETDFEIVAMNRQRRSGSSEDEWARAHAAEIRARRSYLSAQLRKHETMRPSPTAIDKRRDHLLAELRRIEGELQALDAMAV